MASILDLDAGFLSSCVYNLDVRTQGAVLCACKLMAVIVNEVRQESTYLESAVTADVDSSLADLLPKLIAPPSMGLMFSTGRLFDTEEERRAAIKKLACSLPPAAHLVGGEVGTLVGTCPDGSLAVRRAPRDQGFALSLGSFPEADVSSFVVKVPEQGSSRQEITDQLQEQGALNEGWKVIVVMALCDCDELLEVLQEKHPDAAIIGGIMNGRWMVRMHAHRIHVVHHGVIGLMFRGNVPLSALVSQGQHSASTQLRRAKEEAEAQGKSVLGGLMFTCCARDEGADAKAFTATFPNTPLAGMPCNGEIGPNAPQSSGCVTQVGNVQLQGYTAVYGLFSHPARVRTAPLYFAELEDAYRQSRTAPAALAAASAVESLRDLPGDGHREVEVEEQKVCLRASSSSENDSDYLDSEGEEVGGDSQPPQFS